MPQLTIADFPPQLVWLAITFVVLYFLMARVAIPRISDVLENRQNRIATDLEEARKLSDDADNAKAEYEAALADARSKAHGIVSELKATMAKEQDASKAKLDATLAEKTMQSLTDQVLRQIDSNIKQWSIKPNATEGYRTAEVTLGGVDCNALSSKTMECKQESGLFFIGEVLDVTGWLGGYNFQWAWSSGWCAGQHV
jgi:predicted flavoprotein YhiN